MTNTVAYTDPVRLIGNAVRLEPLLPAHAEGLFQALRDDEELWRYIPTEMPADLPAMRAYMQRAFDEQQAGLRLPFAVIDKATERVIGSTSYCDISESNRRMEIGWTTYNRDFWRTAVNTECKYLLLKRAFEDLGCIRVQLRTDERNARSRAAIERIGGVFEGINRHDRIVKGGWFRSSANYSLLADEWPARKAWFEERLAT